MVILALVVGLVVELVVVLGKFVEAHKFHILFQRNLMDTNNRRKVDKQMVHKYHHLNNIVEFDMVMVVVLVELVVGLVEQLVKFVVQCKFHIVDQ